MRSINHFPHVTEIKDVISSDLFKYLLAIEIYVRRLFSWL